jgi:hypothetical protein
MDEITVKLWWDDRVPDVGWAWTTFINGAFDNTGGLSAAALNCDSDEALLTVFRAECPWARDVPDTAIRIE